MPPGRPIQLKVSDAPRDPDAARDAAVATLTRAAISIGLAALEKKTASEIARRYGDRGLDLVLRAATTPTSVAGSPALAQIATAFLDVLTPASAGVALLTRGVKLAFDGHASIVVPGIAIPAATFIGEGMPIPVRKAPTTPGPTLSPHKLAVIVVLTGEMMRSVNAEQMVRQVLIESVGPSLDQVLLSASAATADAPAGLLNGIAALTPSTATDPTNAMTADLTALTGAVSVVSGNSTIAFVAHPAEALSVQMRTFGSFPHIVLQSNQVPVKTLIAVAINAVVSAIEGLPVIDARSSVAIDLADPAAPIVDVGGVVGQYIGSTYQTDEIALRLKWPIDWGLRTPNGIAWMQNVTW